MPLIAAPGSATANAGSPKAGMASPALEWLWQFLRDVPQLKTLDCGPIVPATAEILFKRGSKLYVASLLEPLQRRDPGLWERRDKQLVFRADEFLALLPPIPPASLTLILGWHLLDLLPPEGLAAAMNRLMSYLEPGGVFLCLLREPYLTAGVDTAWRLDGLKHMDFSGPAKIPFPYPALTNRQMELLAPGLSVKTFLTRTGRREIVVRKPEGVA